jgi:hypothetical protein
MKYLNQALGGERNLGGERSWQMKIAKFSFFLSRSKDPLHCDFFFILDL